MKKEKNYVIVYGTLKWAGGKSKNCYNFNRFSGQKVIKKNIEVDGFNLFNLGFYPAAARGQGKILAELHEVENKAFSEIQAMEASAGYKKDSVILNLDNEEISATIFTYSEERLKSYPKIESGEWI